MDTASIKQEFTGIVWDKVRKSYNVRYNLNGVRYYLGLFKSIEEAYCVREAFEYAAFNGEIEFKQNKHKASAEQIKDYLDLTLFKLKTYLINHPNTDARTIELINDICEHSPL